MDPITDSGSFSDHSIGPESLERLQSSQQVALLDAVDRLRSQGVGNHDISLPQLIVCGDQSSGKSSVLEGLTRLRFPTKDGLCTTFATELILRKATDSSITCAIIPSKNRSEPQKRELAKFRRTFQTRQAFDFQSLLNEAKDTMRFGSRSVFLEDTLQIRYTGPELPSLTIVDLPGLIQSEIGVEDDNGRSGPDKVKSLVQAYMRDEKSIILAVVSARADLELQNIFELVKKVDPHGHRTLGIITKPDTLDPGSDSEARFMKLATNQLHPWDWDLGWHVVKNRSFRTREQTDTERDESEREFLSEGTWQALPRSDVGIDALRSKLSMVLLSHIRKELPSLISNIRDAVRAAEVELKQLGDPRKGKVEKQLYLSSKAERFQLLTKEAMEGSYGDPFFDLESTDAPSSARLRTEIQNLNIAFAHIMYFRGHTWEIIENQQSVEKTASVSVSEAMQKYSASSKEPIRVSRSQFLEHEVGTRIRQSRPEGLTAIVNPRIVGEIFRGQSKHWKALAQQHLERVFQAVREYVDASLQSLMDAHTFNKLILEHVDEELEKKWVRLEEKLLELLVPYQKHAPITYDLTFMVEIQEMRARRKAATFPFAGRDRKQEEPQQLLLESMDDFTSSEILDLMQTYYKRALSVFINNVAVLAIESCLLADLATIFTPTLILHMDEEQLNAIASEPQDVRIERADIEKKLEDLRAGKRTLDVHASEAGAALRKLPRRRNSRSEASKIQRSAIRPQTPPHGLEDESDSEEVEELAVRFRELDVTPPPRYSETRRQSPSAARHSYLSSMKKGDRKNRGLFVASHDADSNLHLGEDARLVRVGAEEI
ncbi:P-loop containing nucleoside triphosphate hydrolase protein [Polyplosphaeria fusca]|uniref:P-loop containing nucleoside triphosphate hydrolase protein n=1 Tax=Polyplosphaeria fusca TaxID=682080 RepID=A0A9P4R4E0_9PLEO|nr:P-loop containing nucleoside triphosphate hydrolase protein [Polyplosphaeria fusca]